MAVVAHLQAYTYSLLGAAQYDQFSSLLPTRAAQGQVSVKVRFPVTYANSLTRFFQMVSQLVGFDLLTLTDKSLHVLGNNVQHFLL